MDIYRDIVRGGVMHKHHIADILTFTRFLCVIGLLITNDARIAFLLFAIGELTDAFDGIAARRWPYPEDGKRRRWREFADRTDIVADISLAIAAIIFITFHVNFAVGCVILLIGAAIAIPIELFTRYMVHGPSRIAFKGEMPNYYWMEIRAAEKINEILAERVVLKRRYLYVLGIAVGLLIMLWAPVNDWVFIVKVTFTGLGALIGAVLWIVKRDRRTEWHTPLVRVDERDEDEDDGHNWKNEMRSGDYGDW